MRDWRGTLIVVGSVIVYPGRQSSSLWMTEAVVEEILSEQKFSGTCVMGLKVRITGSSQGWLSVKGKLSHLTALDKITVIG